MYTCECGKSFEKRQSFIAHCQSCRVHLGDERYVAMVEKRNATAKKAGETISKNNKSKREELLEKWISECHTCEMCGKIMTEKYASGRFCSEQCARSFSTKNMSYEDKLKRAENMLSEESRKKSHESLARNNEIRRQKQKKEKEEKWISEQHKCEYCGIVMTELYGSGRFCSEKCVLEYIELKRSTGALNKRRKYYYHCPRCKKGFIDENTLNLHIETCDYVKKDRITLEDVLSNRKVPRTSRVKDLLFANNLKERKCEICGVEIWNGIPSPLELHHIDGNRNNNHLDNLQILCPNCHAQTENYKGKNIRKKKKDALQS